MGTTTGQTKMILTNILEQDKTSVRYSTDTDTEFTKMPEREVDLLHQLHVRTNHIRYLSFGIEHYPVEHLPYKVSIVLKLSSELVHLLKCDLKDPVLEFEYKGKVIDQNILFSCGIIPYEELYEITQLCNQLCANIDRKDLHIIRPVFVKHEGTIVLYRLPLSGIVRY